jgi:hypothetical protein
MNWFLVLPNMVEDAWSIVGNYFEAEATFEDGLPALKKELHNGEAQLWLGRNDAGDYLVSYITELRTDGDQVFTAIRLLVGRNRTEWIDGIDTLAIWSIYQGAKWIEIFDTRPGWKKILPALGFVEFEEGWKLDLKKRMN